MHALHIEENSPIFIHVMYWWPLAMVMNEEKVNLADQSWALTSGHMHMQCVYTLMWNIL